ncbi:hypothetical protein H6P81_002845 [Aristolochia fimbriata]|uniref:Pectinesterase catalytic domain-containing protein n=1 Tax=Aristolochia fimbriata TaxID=158543 RepID=A0AAV7FE49_ARIFI|nr:hypothetical protein H6P81_002845 [Aristolochia fimbriata]
MVRILNFLAILLFLVAGLMVVLRLTLLRPHHNEYSPTVIVPRMTVAQDGSGDFLSIADAVAAAPNYSHDLFGILIRSGVYPEAVRVPVEKTKLVFIGEDSTVEADKPADRQAVAYLGRPGGEYSTVVFIYCFLDRVVSPQGWLPAGANESVLRTLYYGEFQNRGPGASTVKRVTWPGFRVIRQASEARKFTVASFIDGKQWLPQTTVKFDAGLI